MKKKFMLPCIAAVAIATFVGTKAFKSNACEGNALLMENVEALSLGGDANQEKKDCYKDIKNKKASTVVYCGSCNEIPGAAVSGLSKC